MFRILASFWLIAVLAACQSADVPPAATPRAQAKLLATVFMSPTPNEAEQQATRLAVRPTLAPTLNTPEPTPTVYIGVFLEPGVNPDAEMPIIEVSPVGVFAGLEQGAPECPNPPDATFGETWAQNLEARRAIGCPIEVVIPFSGTVQVFERGVMYYQPDGAIWAIAPGGALEGRYWTLPQAPTVDQSEAISAPDGLKVPILGFGAVWRSLPDVRDALGFARLDEQPINAAYQRFENGMLFADTTSGLVFMLVGANTAYGPY